VLNRATSWLSANWSTRLADRFPAIPTMVALAGLLAIVCVLAPAHDRAQVSGRGATVETVAIVAPAALADVALRVRNTVNARVPEEVRSWARDLYANPMLYLVVPFLLLLEHLFPCKRSRPLLAKAYLQDIVWFVASAPIQVLIGGAVGVWLGDVYESHLSFLTIASARHWPGALQLAAGILLSEFVGWFIHMANHKMHALWVFHAVHHSQKELNIFTQDRVHVVDRLFGQVVSFVPLFMFQVPVLYAVAVVTLYGQIHQRFVHANVKMNLGSLGYVLVSPQFHRVHHSRDPAHRDCNFGVVLSVFDHLFGTACSSRDVYPLTGIADEQFPTEDKSPLWQLPWNWVRQTAYPFGQLLSLFAAIGAKRPAAGL
jgi:sterol desaturase/sphingolipid hydroxylase (fatty acid hydroxylase superfamily)